MKEEGRDWERKAEMLREAEIEMDIDTKKGCRERRKRRESERGKERSLRRVGDRQRKGGGRRETERASCFIHGW